MDQLKSFYSKQLELHKIEATRLFRTMSILSLLRVLVFISTIFGIYLTYLQWQLAGVIGVCGSGVFLFLLSKYTDLKSRQSLHKKLVLINEDELQIAAGNFQTRPDGSTFKNPKHFYSLDIDLFGEGSFFQYMNRSISLEGQFQLANALKANNILGIKERQDAIRELSTKIQWVQRYSATASLIETKTPASTIIKWLKNYKPGIPKAMKWIPSLFIVATLTILMLVVFNRISIELFGYWLFVGLGITALYLKVVNNLASNSSKTKETFKQYALLLFQIEKETFTAPLLVKKQKQIQSKGKKASDILSEFSKLLDALDNRNNLIGALFGNGYFLSDIKNARSIEQWISKYSDKVEDWFEVVSFFDAYNSLGTYTFNHQEYVFPKITHNKTTICVQNLGHPLLKATKRITNDLTINNQEFFIVTGANMAGKSTFLRTVSLHIVMANVGLPVCATKSTYSPIKLITSMRTSDSLTDDSSYFFSELTRLKFIVDAIAKEPYFIILDEILKGTNSTDKAIGSRKFVEKLIHGQATGIIATHDLSLCEISEALDEVKNYYFDAQIVNDELYFDYKFKQGICQNMNASFLLEKMDIV